MERRAEKGIPMNTIPAIVYSYRWISVNVSVQKAWAIC